MTSVNNDKIVFRTARRTTTCYRVGQSLLGKNIVSDISQERPFAVIGDIKVVERHSAGLSNLLNHAACLGALYLEGGEDIKTLAKVSEILEFLENSRLPKHGVVVAIGGGTVCDVVGFTSSIMHRGVELALIPTSLLAQVDAAIGGKNGINSLRSKNRIGQFHHPSTVLCDENFLRTLDRRQIICGLAEIIKVFAISSAQLLTRYLIRPPAIGTNSETMDWAALVTAAIRQKLLLLKDDPFETSAARTLNYGHAFAHLIEEQSGFTLLHGEAVLMGMLVENEIGRMIGVNQEKDMQILNGLITTYLCPEAIKYWKSFDEIEPELLKISESRRGLLNLVSIPALGSAAIIESVAPEVIKSCWVRVEHQLTGTAH